MSTKAVEQSRKAGNVENMPDQNTLAVEDKDGRAVTEDQGKRVVAHLHGQSRDGFVADEAQLVRYHMVSGPSVSDCEPTVMEREDNRWFGEGVEKVPKTWGQMRWTFRGGQRGRWHWKGWGNTDVRAQRWVRKNVLVYVRWSSIVHPKIVSVPIEFFIRFIVTGRSRRWSHRRHQARWRNGRIQRRWCRRCVSRCSTTARSGRWRWRRCRA
jgi:hypothetical protein